MKKTLRLLVKIVITPAVLFTILLLLAVGYAYIFYDWLWETDAVEAELTTRTVADLHVTIKNWFTTI